jgi:hypothetical protein
MLQGRVWLPKCSSMSGPAAGRLLLLPCAGVSNSRSHDWHMRSVAASQSAGGKQDSKCPALLELDRKTQASSGAPS